MIGAFARKFFGSANDRRVKGYQSRVNAINALEPEVAALSDEALRNKTSEYRHKLARGAKLDDILPEAFASLPAVVPPMMSKVAPRTPSAL